MTENLLGRKSIFTESLLGRKSIFWTINGITGLSANPGRAPILRTKSVTKKKLKYMILAGFEPGPPGWIANTITTELKKFLPNAVVRYCI